MTVMVGCSLAPGCAMMHAKLGSDLAQVESSEQKDDSEPAADAPSFLVEIRPDGDEPERFRLPLDDDMSYVEQVLKKSGIGRRFRRVKIQVWRPLEHGEGYHKLKIPYNRKTRGVARGYDYAIHPDDLVIFVEDKSTIVDDMLGSVSDTLGQFTP